MESSALVQVLVCLQWKEGLRVLIAVRPKNDAAYLLRELPLSWSEHIVMAQTNQRMPSYLDKRRVL